WVLRYVRIQPWELLSHPLARIRLSSSSTILRGAAVKIEALLVSITLGNACAPPEDAAPLAPDPIGEELLSFSTALGLSGCGEAHLYRSRRALQLQCFAVDGSFSWENHGTLSAEGEAMLEV